MGENSTRMGELDFYGANRPSGAYTFGNRVKDALTVAGMVAALYIQGSCPTGSMEDRLKDGGISDLTVMERVIWGENKQLDPDSNPIDQLGSAWYLMHGPS